MGGELTLNRAEVSDARWLTVDEICRLDESFEGDREFYRKILPSLSLPQTSSRVAAVTSLQAVEKASDRRSSSRPA